MGRQAPEESEFGGRRPRGSVKAWKRGSGGAGPWHVARGLWAVAAGRRVEAEGRPGWRRQEKITGKMPVLRGRGTGHRSRITAAVVARGTKAALFRVVRVFRG